MENQKIEQSPLELENHRLLMHFLQALIKEQNFAEAPDRALNNGVSRANNLEDNVKNHVKE